MKILGAVTVAASIGGLVLSCMRAEPILLALALSVGAMGANIIYRYWRYPAILREERARIIADALASLAEDKGEEHVKK